MIARVISFNVNSAKANTATYKASSRDWNWKQRLVLRIEGEMSTVGTVPTADEPVKDHLKA